MSACGDRSTRSVLALFHWWECITNSMLRLTLLKSTVLGSEFPDHSAPAAPGPLPSPLLILKHISILPHSGSHCPPVLHPRTKYLLSPTQSTLTASVFSWYTTAALQERFSHSTTLGIIMPLATFLPNQMFVVESNNLGILHTLTRSLAPELKAH